MSIPKESKRNPKAAKRSKVSAKERETLAKSKRQADITSKAESVVRVVRSHITNGTFKAALKAEVKALLSTILGKPLSKATDEEKLVAKTRANREVYKHVDKTVNRDTLKTYLALAHKALNMPLARIGGGRKGTGKASKTNKKSDKVASDEIEVPVDLTTDKAVDILTSIMSRFDLDEVISIIRHSAARAYGDKKHITVRVKKAA